MMNIGVKQLQMLTEEFENRRIINALSVKDVDFIYCDYMENSGILELDEKWSKLDNNTLIEGNDKHFWIHFVLDLDKVESNKEYRLKVSTGHKSGWDAMNPQMLLYIDNVPVCGMDANHQEVFLPREGVHEVYIYAHTGMADAKFPLSVSVLTIDVNAEQLYYDFKTAFDSCVCLGEESEETNKIVNVIKKAAMLLDLRNCSKELYDDSIIKARDYLEENLYNGNDTIGDKPITCIGHTHIDVAWLWTLSQTREKVQRSFSTVLCLMDKYPEYKFMSSQPQLYKYFKETQPDLYKKLKDKVKEKKWEPEGALWLESDCNNISGESLIRQIMYGKRFFKNEFGVDNKIAWLPDVFGFCASIPQIFRKCGIEHFVTSKLSWNETNKMPYDTFYWKGIDGSRIFTNFITSRACPENDESDTHTDYNGKITPTYALGTYKRYQHKEYNNELFIPFGWGDGGGGATKEMLETQRRLNKGIVGLPKTQISGISDYLDRVKETFDKNCSELKHVPEWFGELYFELHRGTYTAMAKNKRYNRKSEFMQLCIEGLYTILNDLLSVEYPDKTLGNMWETILLNQFHDILPGSSIEKVYIESEKQYQGIERKGKELIDGALEIISKNINSKSDGILVYNPNSFICSDYIKYNDKYIFADNIPPFGWKIVTQDLTSNDTIQWKQENILETPYYTVEFGDNWNLVSIYDKEFGKEIIKPGELGNRLEIYENYPYCYDAWEISEYYSDKVWYIDSVEAVDKFVENGVAGIKITRKFNNTVIVQKILFYEKVRRIDFDTAVDWHEDKLLLKVAFPWNLYSNYATYDIPFGNISRATYCNTSWDKARFEVNAHKWVDVSEADYGISLLNDCKYGHNVVDSTVRLSLLTSPIYPNPNADRGENEFSYSILPHSNTATLTDTIKSAYAVNQKFRVVPVVAHEGVLDEKYSAIKCNSDTVIIETVKKAELGEGIVVRLYQSARKREKVKLDINFEVKKVFETSMLENIEKEIELTGKSIYLEIKPFEVVTLLLK